MKRIIVHISESKGKKEKSPRSIFYSKLMKNLGGQTGDDLASAFTKGESEKFRSLMQQLCDRMEKVEQDQSNTK